MENEALVRDLVEWVAACPRSYQDVMQGWRTSCPRLTIWEDAVDARLVVLEDGMVRVTPRGLRLIEQRSLSA